MQPGIANRIDLFRVPCERHLFVYSAKCEGTKPKPEDEIVDYRLIIDVGFVKIRALREQEAPKSMYVNVHYSYDKRSASRKPV